MRIQMFLRVIVGLVLLNLVGTLTYSAPVPTGRPHRKAIFQGHRGTCSALAFTPDSQMLASGGYGDLSVRVFDTTTGQNRANFKDLFSPRRPNIAPDPTAGPGAMGLAFSPDGKVLAAIGNDAKIKLLDPTTGQVIRTLNPERGDLDDFPQQLLFSPDGKTLATLNHSRLDLLDLQTKKAQRVLKDYDGLDLIAAFDPEGKLLVVGTDPHESGGSSSIFSLWDAETGKKRLTFKGHTATVARKAISRDGKMVASAGQDQTVRLWDTATGKNTLTLKDIGRSPWNLAFSPDGKVLAFSVETQGAEERGPRRFAVYLYETATGKRLATLKGDPGSCSPLVFSPNGRLLAGGNHNGQIELWELPLQYEPDE